MRKSALARLKGWRELAGRDGARAINPNGASPESFTATVDVTLSTHDAGGLTELDIKLAETMDKLAG